MGRCAPPMPWAEPESHLESTQEAHHLLMFSMACQYNVPSGIFHFIYLQGLTNLAT